MTCQNDLRVCKAAELQGCDGEDALTTHSMHSHSYTLLAYRWAGQLEAARAHRIPHPCGLRTRLESTTSLAMALQKTGVTVEGGETERLAELFEACKNGDLDRVAQLTSAELINAQDVSGRKSTPLHFAAGKFMAR